MSEFPVPNRIPKVIEEKEVESAHSEIDGEVMFIMRDKLRPKTFHEPGVIPFIMAYLECRDVRQAGDMLGLTYRRASSLRRRKDISQCIADITASAAVMTGVDAGEVVERVKEVAFVDPAMVVDRSTGAAYTNLWDVPPEVRRAVKKMTVKNLFETDANGIKVKIGELVNYEFHDKIKANGMLGAEVGKFKETIVHEHGPTKDMREILLGGIDRAKERALEIEAAVDVTPEEDGE